MEEVTNFTAARRASRSRSTSGETSTSLTSSPSTVHSFDSANANLDSNKPAEPRLSPLYQSFWETHTKRAKEEGGYRVPGGRLIACPTLENHSTKNNYCDALFLAHGALRRMSHFEVDNVDLPSNEFDLRSLNSDEAFVVIEEQISGTLREELVHAEFIVGEETKIFDKILGLSQKGRLRTAIEKFLTERAIDWSPAGDDRLRIVLPASSTVVPVARTLYSPPKARFGRLQSLKEVKLRLPALESLKDVRIHLPGFTSGSNKTSTVQVSDDERSSSSIELGNTARRSLPPTPTE